MVFSSEILDKLKARDFNATSLSTYAFSTLYNTLPHNLIKDKLIDLIERTFKREGSLYLARNDRNAFFTSEKPKKYHAWSCQNVCDALTFLLDNIFIRFSTKLYRQVVEIPMGTNLDAPRSTSYGVYISQLIRFSRASSYVADFNTRNKLLTQKLLKQGYRYHKFRKTFSKFYRRYYNLIS